MKGRLAIYPGSFDPVTYGHVDVIERGLTVFDEVIVLIAESSQKAELFSIAEKKEMLRDVLKNKRGVAVDNWAGLLMDYARRQKASAVLRGLRAVSDFEYEFQMASMNKKLFPDIDTFFVMTSEKYHYVSSRLVREVASLGGSLRGIVPASVEKRLREKFK